MPVTISGKFEKQSREVCDYDINFGPWFAQRNLTPNELVVEVEPGINLVAHSRDGMMVKIILAGGTGTPKTRYKITALLNSTSSPALRKEVDFYVTVKDI